MATLGSLLKLFIPAFLLFLLIGAYAGFNARESQVLAHIVRSLEVEHQNEVYSLVYQCGLTQQRISYSVDADKWQITGKLPLIPVHVKQALAIPTARFEEYQGIISSLLGGVTGGVTLQSMLKRPPQVSLASHLKKTLVGVIGGVSGYSSGYWLGQRYDTDCDSEVFSKVINDKNKWQAIERARLLISALVLQNLEDALLSQTGNAINDWQQDPAFKCSERLIGLKQQFDSLTDTEIVNPVSNHFAVIHQMTKLHQKIASTEAYKVLITNNLATAELVDKFIKPESVIGKRMADKKAQWQQACETVSEITL